jgi:hypothetical protein
MEERLSSNPKIRQELKLWPNLDVDVLEAVLATFEHFHIKKAVDIQNHLAQINTYQQGFSDPLAEVITFGAYVITKV